MKTLGVFDLVNSINTGKEPLMDGDDSEEVAKVYNPYLTNVALSYFVDTVLHANLMNQNFHLDNRTQYTFLFNSIRKKKRFSKWHKADNTEDLTLLCNHYGVSKTIAREYLSMLPVDELEKIKQHYNATGGLVNARK